MRIVVNDIAASTGGALTVLKDFYQYINENETEHEWIFLLGDSYIEQTDRIKVHVLPKIKRSRMKKLMFDFFTGRKYINAIKPDIVFSMQNILTFGVKAPQAVYIHQSLPFQKEKRFSFLKAAERAMAVYQYLIGAVIKLSACKADRIIVQTKWMKSALIEQLHIDDNRIAVVLPNVMESSKTAAAKEYRRNNFFYPTSNAVYKNNDCIFEACKILHGKGIDDFTVKLTISSDTPRRNVIYTGRISKDEVFDEYSRSVMVFPSYIETFGYPLAEARRMGCIILASDCAFSREILQGYENAYFFNPFKPEELAELMHQVITGAIEKKYVPDNSADSKNNTWRDVVREVTIL